MNLYYLLFLLFVGITQNIHAKSIEIDLKSTLMAENTFPPMAIKIYTGGEPIDGIFPCKGNLFIVQSEPHVQGFESRTFEFFWYVRDSSGNIVSSRYVSPCGIQVGTYMVNVPNPGMYTVGVELKDLNGNSTIVERTMQFGVW